LKQFITGACAAVLVLMAAGQAANAASNDHGGNLSDNAISVSDGIHIDMDDGTVFSRGHGKSIDLVTGDELTTALDGLNGTDGVDGLDGLDADMEQVDTNTEDIAANEYKLKKVSGELDEYQTTQDGVDYRQDQRLAQTNRRVDTLEFQVQDLYSEIDRLDQGMAANAALAAVPLTYREGFTMGAGIATYNGTGAVALRGSYSDGKYIHSAGVGLSGTIDSTVVSYGFSVNF